MAPIRSASCAVIEPRSFARARECRRSRLSSSWMPTTSTGAAARKTRVRRHDVRPRTTSVAATSTRFSKNVVREAVTTPLVWSTSVMTVETSWPPRVRWKKPSGITRRWSKSCTRSSRTRPSWIPTRICEVAYPIRFLRRSPPTRITTIRPTAWSGVVPARIGSIARSSSSSSRVDPVPSGPAVPKRCLSSGTSTTTITPSRADARKVVRTPRRNWPRKGRRYGSRRRRTSTPQLPRGVRRAIGRITSSGETPPWRNAPR